jgi:anti-sigma B factor antagonist
MKYTIEKQDKFTVFKLDEEKLDATISPILKSTLVSLNAEGNKWFVIDLAKVKYIDSSGLSAILIINRLCNEQEGSLVLKGVNEQVMDLMKKTGLDGILKIKSDNNTTTE